MALREKIYCAAHKTAKNLLSQSVEPDVSFGYVYRKEDFGQRDASTLYYGENESLPFPSQRYVKQHERIYASSKEAWRGLIEDSVVPNGWKNSGFCKVCYDKKVKQWCLSSWIWTSAAIARYAVNSDDIDVAIKIADAFLESQQSCGGWVVRNDYRGSEIAPMLAPNDSSYIANNALLSVYEVTGDTRYLDAAKRCADWVIDTALDNGLVSTGYDLNSKRWINNAIIVDIGFTSGLFAKLSMLAGDEKYHVFMEDFVSAYIFHFRDPESGVFATSVDESGVRNPGRFARGQAWALEGLIPAYLLNHDKETRLAIEGIVACLTQSQSTDGGWAYNLVKPLMGQDCKGIPVIAKSLVEWGLETSDKDLLRAGAKALDWCKAHTDLEGDCAGGIFSYCMEGAVTHYLYSEAAFVYSSAYALEVDCMLERYRKEGDRGE